MKQPKVTVVGSFNFDLAMRTPRMPVKGETILGGPFHMGPGGKGANQAVAAARLGADVTMVVKLGKDLFGDIAHKNLVEEGVKPDHIIRTEETHTGTATILLDSAGENMIVVAAGANTLLSPADLEAARQSIGNADVLLVQLEIPMGTVRHAISLAHEAGVPVLLNPAPGLALVPELLRQVSVLTPNETEAEIITGLPVRSLTEAEAAGHRLVSLGVNAAVITLGGQGALIVTAEVVRHVAGRTVQVVDTTGAGDAFSGALAVALAEGQSLVDAVEFATVAASIQVTRLGTAPAMARRWEVEEALASHQ